MCKISFEKIENNKLQKGKGTGFFCKMNVNFPFKYALFTNNHILNRTNTEIGSTIKFEYYKGEKKIKITPNRRVYTNEELDYTCIELFNSDNIYIDKYFEIDQNIFKYNKEVLQNSEIFILQYPNGNEISFSNGKILFIKGNKIIHNSSTEGGSSGSPIIRRCEENYVIGLHFGGIKKNEYYYQYNLSTPFDIIIKDINNDIISEINCIYIIKDDEKEINLIHDYNEDDKEWTNEELRKLYLEVKEINKKLFKENIELYVNKKKIPFNYKYKINDNSKEINVKFKFNKLLTNTTFMFYHCSSLKSIDLSSFNTNKVTNMEHMFRLCSTLKSIDLSSFNTKKVINMRSMFFGCRSLESIDLSSFNTTNVTNMAHMFQGCRSLESIDLSSFNTTKVTNMEQMFFNCSSLKLVDLSSFNTNKVTDMKMILYGCSSLKKENIKINNKDSKLLNEIKEYYKK